MGMEDDQHRHPRDIHSYPADIPSPYASRKDEKDLLREVDQKFKDRGKLAKPHLIPSPYASRKDEEDLLREVDQKFKDRGKLAKPHLSSQSKRRSKSQLRPGSGHTPLSKWANPAFSSHGTSEGWKSEKTGAEDIDVVEVTTAKDSPKYCFTKSPNIGPEYVRKDGTGLYPVPQFSFKDPVVEKSTLTKMHADRPQPGSYELTGGFFAKEPKGPRRQPSAEQTQECSSDKDDKYCPHFHPLIVNKLTLGRPKPNVFAFQETSPPPGDDKPVFNKPFDFTFAGGVDAQPFGPFTSSDEEKKYYPYFHLLTVNKLTIGRPNPNVFAFQDPSPAPEDEKTATPTRQEFLEELLKQVSASLEPMY